MTPLDNELIAMREMATYRVKKVLRMERCAVLDSILFTRCARGLRASDWRGVIDHLVAEGVLVTGTSERGALMLSLKVE
jgi:hypothetical protein